MVHISEKIIAQIKQEAQKAYPNECCGFILGRINSGDKFAEKHLESRNSTEDSEKYHRFVITPEDMMSAERYASSERLDIIGFYHSHPDCAAVPSEYDRSHALPVYSYIIVSVRNGKAEECKSWELDKNYDYKKFKSEFITVRKGDVK